MKRLHNWSTRLATLIEAVENEPFKYGEFDCGIFVAACITAQTGVDLYSDEYGGTYTDAESAVEALAISGHRSLYAFCRHTFGNPVKNWGLASRGDVVLMKGLDGPALGIVWGHKALFVGQAFAEGEEVKAGLVRYDLRDVRHVFKVA